MTEQLYHLRNWLAFAALIVGSTGICLLCGPWISPQTTSADDGWRRTERGWERVVASNQPAMATTTVPVFHSPPPLSAKSSHRWDTHPAALALVQLTAGIFALFARPGSWRLSESSFLSRLPALIAKSFRASAFG
jgi:hypothetical protein